MGVELLFGQVGEIVINGLQVMCEYWQWFCEIEEVFIEIGGWCFFCIGDLGYMDEEGYFFFVDCFKCMVNVLGFKVWFVEVENKLYGYFVIQEVCVILVFDECSGECVCVLIVLCFGMEVILQDIEIWVCMQMVNYKVLCDYQFVDSLLCSFIGKVVWCQFQEQVCVEMVVG